MLGSQLRLVGVGLGRGQELLGIDARVPQRLGDALAVARGAEVGNHGGRVGIDQRQDGAVPVLGEELLELLHIHLVLVLLLALVAGLGLRHLLGLGQLHELQNVAQVIVRIDRGLVLGPHELANLLAVLLLVEGRGDPQVVIGVGVDEVMDQIDHVAAGHVLDVHLAQDRLMQLDCVVVQQQLFECCTFAGHAGALVALVVGHLLQHVLPLALEQLLDQLGAGEDLQPELAEQGAQVLPQELDAGLAVGICDALVVVDEHHHCGRHSLLLVLLAGHLLGVDHVDNHGHGDAQQLVALLMGLTERLDRLLDGSLGGDVAGHDAVDDVSVGQQALQLAVVDFQAVLAVALLLTQAECRNVLVTVEHAGSLVLMQHEYHRCFLLFIIRHRGFPDNVFQWGLLKVFTRRLLNQSRHHRPAVQRLLPLVPYTWHIRQGYHPLSP